MKSLALGLVVGKYSCGKYDHIKFTSLYQALLICCTVVLPQQQPEIKQGVAGISRIDVVCSIANDYGEEGVDFGNIFWIINGSVYGLLQVPGDFSVCSSVLCDLNSLVIHVLKSEMDGITIQCAGIDYLNNTQYLGGVTVLEVFPLPQGQLNRNGKLALTTDTSLTRASRSTCTPPPPPPPPPPPAQALM